MKEKLRKWLAAAVSAVMAASAVSVSMAANTGRIEAADSIIWRASKQDASKVRGDALDTDGHLTLGWTPDRSGETSVTISGASFDYYITHSTQNGGWSSGDKAATGPSLKFSAPEDGVFTVYVTNLNSQKTLYISEGGGTSPIVIESVLGSEAGEDCSLSINAEGGKDYYAYVYGSKGRFCGAAFEPGKKIIEPDNLLKNGDFETGKLLPFRNRTSACSVSTDSPNSGDYCAYVSGRGDTWQGIEYDINDMMEENGIYYASAWIRLADNAYDAADCNFHLQAELQEAGQSSVYPIIDTQKAQKGSWIKLAGTFSLENYSLPLDRALLYICSADTNTADFYVDDFVMYAVSSTGTSNPAITEFPTTPIAVTKSSAEVSFNKEMQTIEGFGASGAFGTAQSIKNLPEDKRDEAMTLLFEKDRGIGLTVLRNMLTPAIGLADGTPDLTADSAQGWLMRESRKYGAKKIMTTCWTPPAWMKTNNSTIGGSLAYEHYADFAEYLANYIEAYKAEGIDIDIISPCNEPDLEPSYDGCTWEAEDIADFIKNYLKPELTDRGLETKILSAEEMRFQENKLSAVLADSDAAAAVDIFGVHGYATKTFSHLTNIEATGKPLWMTEIMGYNEQDNTILDGLLWAKRIHQAVAQAGANEWNFWYLAHQFDGGNSALLVLNKYENDFTVPKRLYTIGNYSKFVRPGAKRVDSTLLPNSDVYLSAYKNPDGKEIIVAANGNVNAQTVAITLSGTDTDSFDIYRTSETESLTYSGTAANENGLLTIELPPRTVTTYVTENAADGWLIRNSFLNEAEVNAYGVYPEQGTLSYKDGMLLGQFENGWNEGGNGISLDITNHVKEHNGGSFTASVDFLRDEYYDAAAKLFFETVHVDGIKEQTVLESKIGTANELTTYCGTAALTCSDTDKVYLCMTHPTGYQLYDNISLKLSAAEPTIKPTTEPITKPTTEPTIKPTTEPTAKPTEEPEIKELSISLSDDNKTITISAPDKIKSAVLVTAEYSGSGALINLNIKSLSDIPAGRTNIAAAYTKGKIKVFLWDSPENIRPLCNAAEN